eukprot:TRINITY_DN96493_c0_g1_i1.p1 TRINITY_DN96493_c0_g1~~TRINITY_DN96493_c0_g1_i1.p1  ORF type:complete len:432 (-),score=97.65 TRINITY_DN96493_c0_g1_i1:33-1328(-)
MAAAKTHIKMASGAGETFGVDDIAIAWAWSGGFWEREGLEVEWVPKRGGVRTAEAVLEGEVEAGYGTWVPCAKLRGQGKPVRILTSMAQSLAQNLLVRKDKVTETKDLKGRRWAVDGIGALSHTLARLIVRGLGMDDADIEWVESGPPPQRIAALLDGSVDAALVRVEEACVLAREHSQILHNLLDFDRILPLAPMQPHGVLQVSDSFCEQQPDKCRKLVRGLMLASRNLQADKMAFRQAIINHVRGGNFRPEAAPAVAVTDEECDKIWNREVQAGSFAINGGMTEVHWRKEMEMYADLNPGDKGCDLRLDELCCLQYVDAALAELGMVPAPHDQPAAGPEVKVTNKKGTRFYVGAARSFLSGVEAKEGSDARPAEQVITLTALGSAASVAASVAAAIEKDGIGKVSRVQTCFVDLGGKGVPQLRIRLSKV